MSTDEATIAGVRSKYRLEAGDLDPEFGVVALDPVKGLYAVLADDRVASTLEGQTDVQGSFSNPRIAPFGPPSD
ncbi:MAG: hypothetical protein QM674_20495 [Burkholderiaceae bacterium]